jgi:hypothetical protein
LPFDDRWCSRGVLLLLQNLHKEVTFNRHGNTSKAYRSSLRNVTKEDFKQLEVACVEALLNGGPDIIVSFPYTFKFPKGFPKGVRVKEEGPINYQRIKAAKLLKWLFDKGHTIITLEMIRVQGGLFTKLEKEIEEL